MEMIDEKVYFNPGDLVMVRHEALENRPIMYMVEKVSRSIVSKDGADNTFIGVRCRYFDKNQVLREAIFSTKDLVHVK